MLEIRLFGRPRFAVDGEAWNFGANRKTIAVLAYLVTHREAAISREFLATLLWPDDPEEAGRANLRRHLHLVSKALPIAPAQMPYVLNTQHTTRWNPKAPLTLDVADFTVASLTTSDLDRAAKLYTGPFVEEFYDDWIVSERERLLEIQLENLRKLVRRKRGERDLEGALTDVTTIRSLDPWREDAVRIELILRDELGDRSGALAAYRTFAERIRAELDTDPMPETRAAYDTLLRGDTGVLVSDRNESEPGGAGPPRQLPFHGRSVELATLVRSWNVAANGKSTFCIVAGEAGIGKSRLISELALHAEAQGARAYVGSTSPQETAPHEAISDCLRGARALLESCALSPETLARLGRLVPAFALPTPPEPHEAGGPNAQAERFALFEAVAEAFAALARKRPLLVMLEDVHWAGSATFALIDFLRYRLAEHSIAFIATYRTDAIDRAHPIRAFRKSAERDPSFLYLALSRLERDAIAVIARETGVATGDEFERTVDELFAGSEGVPLFLDGALRDGDSQTAGIGSLRIDARLTQLTQQARQLLDLAAVVGAGFDVDVLRDILGWSETEVLVEIDCLIAAYFVREPHRARRNDFTFTHHLVRQAVYEAIEPKPRARRHASIATLFSQLFGDAPDRAATIARHWESAGRADDASLAYARAARHSMTLFASDEAREFAERAISLAGDRDLRCEMLLVRARAADRLGDPQARAVDLRMLGEIAGGSSYETDYCFERIRSDIARGLFDEARAVLERVEQIVPDHDLPRVFAIRKCEADLLFALGDSAAGRALMEESLRASEAASDDAGTFGALEALLWMATNAIDMPMTLSYARRLLERAERVGDLERQARAHGGLGAAFQRSGQIALALEHLQTARSIYERVGNVPASSLTAYNIATVQIMVGRYDIARELFTAEVTRCRMLHPRVVVASVINIIASIELLIGNPDACLTAAREALEVVGNARDGIYAQIQINFGTTFWHLGELERAAGHAEEAIAVMRPYGASDPLAEALLLGVLIAIERDRLPDARAHMHEALNIPDELRRHALFPEMYPWAFARVRELEGDGRAAERLRDEAVALYREHLERLTPEGREFYLRVPWIPPLTARAVASDALRTPTT